MDVTFCHKPIWRVVDTPAGLLANVAATLDHPGKPGIQGLLAIVRLGFRIFTPMT